MPLLTRKRILAAKIEVTPGTAISLAAADATFNVYDMKIEQTTDFQTRDGQGASVAKLPGVSGGTVGKATWKMDLIGGASAPGWMSTFLPAAGFPLTSLVAAPESKPPEASGANTKTLTIGGYQDGKFKSICGAMLNMVFKFEAGKKSWIECEAMGLWVAPSNVALIAPTYVTTAPLRAVSIAMTIGSFVPKWSNFEIDLGNVVVMREDPNNAAGYCMAVIVDRTCKGKFNPEETLTGTHGATIYDPDADFNANTQRALAFSLGTTGNALAFAAPKLQITKGPGDADRNGVKTQDVEFQLNKSASAGDDELTITTS